MSETTKSSLTRNALLGAGIAVALARALADDDLVDAAAAVNQRTAKERIDVGVTRHRIQRLYDRVIEEADGRH